MGREVFGVPDKPVESMIPRDEDGYPLYVRDLSPNTANPFLEEEERNKMISEESSYRSREGIITRKNIGIQSDMIGNEVEKQNIFILKEKVVDHARFTKVYHDKVKEITGIGDSASKLYMLVQKTMPVQTDKIYIDPGTSSYYLKISKRTYHRALRELLKARLIAKADRKNLYYINPFKLFNGNRAVFIQTYIDGDAISNNKSNGEIIDSPITIIDDEELEELSGE